jgi:hypothetical protein
VPKADEGAFYGYVIRARAESESMHAKRSRKIAVCRMRAPLIRLRHLLPPQKARGEKDLETNEP